MLTHSSQRGLATPALLGIIGIVIIVGAAVYFAANRSTTTPEVSPQLTSSPAVSPLRSAAATPATTGSAIKFSGEVLAGSSSPLLDFNQADFELARNSNKVVVLYFFANWCPICREEFPKMQAAFNQLTGDNVVGFRVNFNDNETDDTEVALAREHGIAYQHTKVILKNGQQVLKSPETWETSRYLTEITNASK